MSDGLLKRVDAAFRPALFVNHYGSSEIYFHDRAARRSEAGFGREGGAEPAVQVVKFGASSPDSRAATGEEGQIIADMASDEALEGYWRRPDADARTLHDGHEVTSPAGQKWDQLCKCFRLGIPG